MDVSDGPASDLPVALEAALTQLDAVVTSTRSHHHRTYARCQSGAGELLARWSSDPRDIGRYRHDATVRALVGVALPLRTPPVLAAGSGWVLEPWVDSVPCGSSEQLFAAGLAAVGACASLDLPQASVSAGAGQIERLWQRARLLVSPVSVRHLRRARQVIKEPGLPLASSHGDLHVGNTLVDADGLWVVDWELSGRRPFGYDAAMLAASLADADLLQAAGEWIAQSLGSSHRRAARRLVYAVAVRVAAAKLMPVVSSDGDRPLGLRLTAMLEELAASADLH